MFFEICGILAVPFDSFSHHRPALHYGLTVGPGFRPLSILEVAVVPISSSSGESAPRRRKRSRAPEPSAMGRRTHSPERHISPFA